MTCKPTKQDKFTAKPTFYQSRLIYVLVPAWSGVVPSHTLTQAECSQLVDVNTWLDIWQNLELQNCLIQQQGIHVLTKHDEVETPRQLVTQYVRQLLDKARRPRAPQCACTHTHTRTISFTQTHTFTVIGSDTFSVTKLYISCEHICK